MPKITLLLGRRTMQEDDLTGPTVVGREEGADIVIDNPSVSRKHLQIRPSDSGWMVEDLGSSNGTFLNGNRLDRPTPLNPGDEIGIGKFTIVFEKDRKPAAAPAGSSPAAAAQPKGNRTMADVEGTMHINPHEVEELLKSSSQKRRAHLVWESGGQKGTHYFSDGAAVLFGTDDLCDIRVPQGPKHHLLVSQDEHGVQARNLAFWGTMKVRGTGTKKARLRDGDTVEMKGLKLTYAGEME